MSTEGISPCPQCGGEMYLVSDCDEMEESRTCLRCGFAQRWFLLRDEKGFFIEKDGTSISGYTETIGYGSVYLRFKNTGGHIYTLSQPLTVADKEALLKEFQCEDVEDTSYAVMFDPKSSTFTTLAGTIPGAYEDEE